MRDEHGCTYCITCREPKCLHEDESRHLLDLTFGFHPFNELTDARLKRAAAAVWQFEETWDPGYLARFGVGDVISLVVPMGADLELGETSSLLRSAAEEA